MFILAPLLGLTNARFRSVFATHFKGVDMAYAPFISLVKTPKIKSTVYSDLLPERNEKLTVVPQLIGNDAAAFIQMSKALQKLGYTEVNLNLGCPMPLVAKKRRGSGFLPYPEQIDAMLHAIFQEIEIDVSIKTRLGYYEKTEIDSLVDVFNAYPIKSLCIHPRTGKQQYQGTVDLEKFASIYPRFNMEIIYNGDIKSVEDIKKMEKQFPDIDHWMIGRALLKNPFILEEYKQGKLDESEKKKRFNDFVRDFYVKQAQNIAADKSLLNVMKDYWKSFSCFYPDPEATFTHLKRCKTRDDFESRMFEVMEDSF
jgi:tRNA-dihydrouridine synthase